MKSKLITDSPLIGITFLFIESELEWGNDKSNHLRFKIEDGKVASADNPSFKWSVDATISEIECYISAKEKEQYEYQKMIHENFLTKQEKDILLYEEERKKRRVWEENHWVETEGGNGYFH